MSAAHPELSPPRLLLAPMEGLADDVMREVLTGVGGYDWSVAEFIRVTGSLLPDRAFLRVCPELGQGSRTTAGTPVRVQLLGSDPDYLAINARRVALLQPAGIDLNFGCPAPTVNRHRGGAVLLDEPELLHRIAFTVRGGVPAGIPFTAKMRLGVRDTGRALECAQALVAGGVEELVVHGRTKLDNYKPPARWEWIARIREAVPVPVVANGEVWTLEDYRRCREVSGCRDVMLGRGAIADPLLALRIRASWQGEAPAPDWSLLPPVIRAYWQAVQQKVLPIHAPGRLKQWLGYVRRSYPEGERLYQALRALRDARSVSALLQEI